MHLGSAQRVAGLAAPLVAVLAAAPAGADPRKLPEVDFSADVIRKRGDEAEYVARLRYTNVHVLYENTAPFDGAVITDLVRKQRRLLNTQSRTYQTITLEAGDEISGNLPSHFKVTKLQDEIVRGFATSKWAFEGGASPTMRFTGTIWITKDGIAIRKEQVRHDGDKRTSMTWEMRNLDVAPVDPKIFSLPAGYTPER
jgi:hypothetical protein